MFIDYGTHIQVLPFPSSLPAFTGANQHVRACEAVVKVVGVLEGRGTAEGTAGTSVGFGAVRAALCSGPMWTGSVGSAQKMACVRGSPSGLLSARAHRLCMSFAGRFACYLFMVVSCASWTDESISKCARLSVS